MSHRAGRAHLCSRADQTVFQKLQAAAPDSQKNKDLYTVPAWTVVAVRIQPEKQSYCELHEMKTLLCTSDLMQKKKKKMWQGWGNTDLEEEPENQLLTICAVLVWMTAEFEGKFCSHVQVTG